MTNPTHAPDVPGDVVSVDVVAMRRRHLRQVVRIDAQSAGDRWSPGLFLAELRRGDGSRCYRVAMAGSRVVGFAGMLYAADDGHVTTVAVDEACRRSGVATALMLELATDARQRGCSALTLEVRAGNAPALALYRRFGFAPAGVRKGYYSDNGEDALVLWANDIAAPAYAERLEALSGGSGATRQVVGS
jgi:ribosomal-protein-alanine N-acetyltransferase